MFLFVNLVQDSEDNLEINFIHVIMSYHHMECESLYYVTTTFRQQWPETNFVVLEVQTTKRERKKITWEKKEVSYYTTKNMIICKWLPHPNNSHCTKIRKIVQ